MKGKELKLCIYIYAYDYFGILLHEIDYPDIVYVLYGFLGVHNNYYNSLNSQTWSVEKRSDTRTRCDVARRQDGRCDATVINVKHRLFDIIFFLLSRCDL